MINNIYETIVRWATENLGKIFVLLRIVKPIAVVKGFAVVTRYEDVEEVLARDDVFHVPYAEKMGVVTDGYNFFLGMENTAQYQRDVSNMRIAARRDDVEKIVFPLVAQEAQNIVNGAGQSGEINFVSQLSSIVPTRMVATYFGTPGPSEPVITDWATVLFEYLFFDIDNEEKLGARAREAAKNLRDYLDAHIVERKSLPAQDDLLGRCLDMQRANLPGTTDIDIRNNLIGLIIGAIPTLNKAASQIMDELLSRPDALQGAQAAAQNNDDKLLERYVLEAFRFRPLSTGILRISAEDYVLGKGHMHATCLPKGTKVIPMLESAMFDARKVRKPKQFRTDRPDHEYMLFGYGLHECFGYYINRAFLPQLIKPLLKKQKLSRVDGDAGQLTMDGQWPQSLRLKFS